MPPASYFLIALILVIAIVAWLAATHMYGIFLVYVLFGAGACLLMTISPFLISYGLKAPFWIGLALAAPALVWAAHRLYSLGISGTPYLHMSMGFRLVGSLALTLAAVACVRLIELVSVSNVATRIVYGILALSAVLVSLAIVQNAIGATWTRNAAYSVFAHWVRWPIIIAKYGALAVAPVMLVVRRHIEVWVLVPIVGIVAVMEVGAAFPYLSAIRGYEGIWFWFQPVVFFIAGAAIWRMGFVLVAQRREQSVLSGVAA